MHNLPIHLFHLKESTMLTVHHLGKSQSERVVWLCEELAIAYELKCYERVPATRLAPAEYKALHPMQAAPVITDGDLVLAESAAVIEYIIAKYGAGRLALAPSHPDYAHYLYWFHYANGSFQAAIGRAMMVSRLDPPPDNPIWTGLQVRLEIAYGMVEARLGVAQFLAGSEFTAADIMTVFSLTTMRYFMPRDITPYPNILAYLQRISQREAYQRAMQKGDPGMELLLS